MRFIILMLFFLLTVNDSFSQGNDLPIKDKQADEAFAQKMERFRFGVTHKIAERASYSIFYPVGLTEYQGVVILIGSDQASNPKAYGKLIEQCLQAGNIVIYPAFQSFGWSNNSKDIDFIKQSLFNAYDDIEANYPSIMTLPVAIIGHSMGAIIGYELALGIDTTPKKPSALISLCPAEVSKHKITQLNFRRLDNYDVYLIIEEEKDKFFRRDVGARLYANLEGAQRKKYLVHKSSGKEKSRHLNAWAFDSRFSSQNNGISSYFARLLGRTNSVDKGFYWPEIDKALQCAFSREGCNTFRGEKE